MHSQPMPLNFTFLQIVVPQTCPELPDLSTGPAGGVEILVLCEWRLAIVGVCAARLALLVGVDAMSISECHAMRYVMVDAMAWHGMPIGIPVSAVHLYFYNSSDLVA